MTMAPARSYSAISSSSSSSSEACCDRVGRRFDDLERHNSQIKIEKGGNLDAIIMTIFCIVFASFTAVVLVGDIWFLPDDRLQWCKPAVLLAKGIIEEKECDNIDAIRDPCYYHRTIYLLGFSPFECDFGRRMICSVTLGAAIGWERKAADRPAGMRAMSLVSLGSATFTMSGQFAFRASTMGWDAARASAAIPSGVGFLGSALIWKEVTGPKGPDQKNHVHGIAAAASVWLSASIGIGVGGALCIMSIWTVVLVLFVLRLVPQLLLDDYDLRSGNQHDLDEQVDTDAHDDEMLENQEGTASRPSLRQLGSISNIEFSDPQNVMEEWEDESLENASRHNSRVSRRNLLRSTRTQNSIRSQKLQAPSFHSD